MNTTRILRAGAALQLVAALSAALQAQAASSKGYFLSGSECAPGATMQTSQFVMTASIGEGVLVPGTSSVSYALAAGFVAGLDTKVAGRPWLTAVTPRVVTLRGAAQLTLSGSDLSLGGGVRVEVNGQQAGLLGVGPDRVFVDLPTQPSPGWQPVKLTNGRGSTTLVQGVGVLPMLASEPAPAPGIPFQVVFKGSTGDQVIWAAGIAPGAPLPLPGIHYGLALNPALLVLLPGFTILGPSGEFRFRVPASAYAGPVYLQAVFTTSNPGYAPASFSNVLRL